MEIVMMRLRRLGGLFRNAMTRTVVIAVGIGAFGCASAPIGTLSGVIRDGRLAEGIELGDVSVIRDGDPVGVAMGMSVRKGDTISTGPGSRAVIIFQDEWEVVTDPGTTLYVVNPSTWLERGKVFVKKLVQRARERFRVQDRFVSYTASATQFAVSSDGAGTADIAVVEGEVVVESKRGAFAPVVYAAMQKGRVTGDSVIVSMGAVSAAEAQEILSAFEEAERLTTVRVPELQGLLQDEAERRLAELGLRRGDTRSRLTGTVQVGAVVEHTPSAGTPVRTGTAVDMVIEEEGARVPALEGLPRVEAETLLRERGLRVTLREVDAPNREPGTVISQSPGPEALVRPGTQVTLTVVSVRVEVPNVVRSSADGAVAMLEEMGLRVVLREREAPNQREGFVIEQSLRPGSRVRPGTQIQLIVAVRPRVCVVPNVLRLTDEEATERIANAGLRVGRRSVIGEYDRDRVGVQNPPAGQQRPCGSTVDLSFGTIG
jgi:beta-lactam-binding protein with PASTA domain